MHQLSIVLNLRGLVKWRKVCQVSSFGCCKCQRSITVTWTAEKAKATCFLDVVRLPQALGGVTGKARTAGEVGLLESLLWSTWHETLYIGNVRNLWHFASLLRNGEIQFTGRSIFAALGAAAQTALCASEHDKNLADYRFDSHAGLFYFLRFGSAKAGLLKLWWPRDFPDDHSLLET